MGWIDALRKAEKEGFDAAHRSYDKARASWEDAERRLRRKMRIFPSRRRRPAPAGTIENVDLDSMNDNPPALTTHKDNAA